MMGRVIEARAFPNHAKGHEALLAWVSAQAKGRRIGVKGSLNYAAALTKLLLSRGEDIREVPASLTREMSRVVTPAESIREALSREELVDMRRKSNQTR